MNDEIITNLPAWRQVQERETHAKATGVSEEPAYKAFSDIGDSGESLTNDKPTQESLQEDYKRIAKNFAAAGQRLTFIAGNGSNKYRHTDSHRTTTLENNCICEAVNCYSQATTRIDVKVGQLGNISLSLCSDCVSKFRDETGVSES